jgi:hypothetical protein
MLIITNMSQTYISETHETFLLQETCIFQDDLATTLHREGKRDQVKNVFNFSINYLKIEKTNIYCHM